MSDINMKNKKELTGKHVLIMFLTMFGIIISVNVFMATNAISTFPGMVVKNSYVASQNFNERKAAQEKLGWAPHVYYKDGKLFVELVGDDGKNELASELNVLIGRNSTQNEDKYPDFVANGDVYVAEMDIRKGYWMVEINAKALDGTSFNQRLDIVVE